MKILIVSKTPTHPSNAGNRWGILAQADILRNLGNEVHFLYIYEKRLQQKEVQACNESLVKTQSYWGKHYHQYTVPILEKIIFSIKKRVFAALNIRQKCDSYYPMGLGSYVRNLDKKEHFDVCIVNYFFLTKLFEQIKISKKALFTHDNYTYKDLAIGSDIRNTDATIDAKQSAKSLQRSPYIFAVQDEEKIFFQMLSPLSKVFTIYSKYDYHPQKVVGNHSILFLSGSNKHNVLGLKWFVKEIFPLIISKWTDAKLYVGGAICNVIKENIHSANIIICGYIDDLLAFYEQGDVAINPVYQGTGLKIKTFEAISYDKVTLVHPHSMTGIFDKNNAPLFASSTPKDWIDYLDVIWKSTDSILSVKKRNMEYMDHMNKFIIKEYKSFLEDKNDSQK